MAHPPRPFRIGTAFYWEETAALLAPITRALDIGLYVEPTPALDGIKDDLLATVLH